jgi:hypothetical protein
MLFQECPSIYLQYDDISWTAARLLPPLLRTASTFNAVLKLVRPFCSRVPFNERRIG